MPQTPYDKPFLTYADQLQKLKDRGLQIENDEKALHLLEHASYYRLSGYWYPLLSEPKTKHLFKNGATFNTSFHLYCFDRELRKLVTAELEKIEIAVRAKMIYVLSEKNGPFWYREEALFFNKEKHAKSIKKLSEEYGKSDEDFIKSFKQNYSDDLPPCWMLFEICSFGSISHLYQNLNLSLEKRAIAKSFKMDHTTFQSWLHSMVYVRNVCAHHSRLWNRKLGIAPNVLNNRQFKTPWLTKFKIPDKGGNEIRLNNTTYYLLSTIVYMLNTINPKHTFKTKFHDLLAKYPNINPFAMGAPAGWQDEPLWS